MKTKRFARLIIYDGTAEALSNQIAKSLPEGTHEKAVNITVINLGDSIVFDSLISKTNDDLYAGD